MDTNSPPSSLARSAVKVTYLERQKRNRTAVDSNEFNSEPAPSKFATKTMASPLKSPAGSPKSMLKASEATASKKIDFRVPDPPLRRVRRDSNESDTIKRSPSSSKTKNSHHIRSSSSVSSLSRVVQQMAASPASSKKPSSIASRDIKQHHTRSMTPDTEMDDNASIAESTTSVSRIRRTEAERLQYFENEPECGEIEPHRALCTRCNKFVKLGNKQTYTVRPWEKHRFQCDQKPASTSDAAPVAPSEKASRTTESQRKAMLESDDRAEDVQPHEAKCRKCQKTIRLSSTTKYAYALANWDRHQSACAGAVPSNRIAAAERKLRIVNDSKAKSFGPRHVVCASCDDSITLYGDSDYNLTNWEEHKSQCFRTDSTGVNTSVPFSPKKNLPPSSSVSEGIVIASEASASAVSPKGIKRAREEPDLVPDDEEARPTTRPRTETYDPPQIEPPSALGWFMLPFKAFVRGFRESLKGADDSS